MSGFGDIFAGFLGGAAQGFAEGETSRIQNMHRAQAQIAVNDATATRRASLERAARQANNQSYLSVLNVSEADDAVLDAKLGEDWRDNVTRMIGAGEGEYAIKQVFDALERDASDSPDSYGETIVGRIEQMHNLDAGEWDKMDNPARQQLFANYLSSTQRSDEELTTEQESAIAVAEASNNIFPDVNRFLPDDLDSAKKGTVKALIDRSLRARIRYHATRDDAVLNEEWLRNEAAQDLQEFLDTYSPKAGEEESPFVAFAEFAGAGRVPARNVDTASTPRSEPEPEATTSTISLEEYAEDMFPPGQQYSLYRGAGNVNNQPAPPARATSAMSNRTRAAINAGASAVANMRSRESMIDAASDIVNKRLPTLLNANGGIDAVILQVRQDSPREYGILQEIARRSDMTIAELIRSVYDPTSGNGTGTGAGL